MRLTTLKKQLILSLIAVIFTSITGFSQAKNYNISVQWQPIQNNYEGKNQSLSVLSILNGSEMTYRHMVGVYILIMAQIY